VVGYRSELRQVGCFGSASFWWFLGERGIGQTGEKSLLPLPRASRKRRKATVPFKTAPFWAFFLMNSV